MYRVSSIHQTSKENKESEVINHMRKPKTEFGIEVKMFTARTGMTLRELAQRSGVKYTTLLDTTVGRCAGVDLIPLVRDFIRNYDKGGKGCGSYSQNGS